MPLAKKKAKKKSVKRKMVKRKAVKRRISRKPAARKTIKGKKKIPAKKKSAVPVLGTVTHYFPHVRAAVIKLKMPLNVGDVIKVKGHTTDFAQQITSMQIDRVPITSAKKGDEIGLLVNSRVRQHDVVYKG